MVVYIVDTSQSSTLKDMKTCHGSNIEPLRSNQGKGLSNYRHFNHAVGLATVHLVWIPCRRKRIFTSKNENIKLRCIEIFNNVATEKKWIIKALEVAPDHIHLLVEYDPHHSIAQVIKAFKGRSSRYLRQEFPILMKLPSLWTNSYMFDTTGKVSTAKIMAYINEPHHR